MLLLEGWKITVWKGHLFKKSLYWRYMPILRKKVFWRTSVMCFSLYGSYNWNSVVFRNVAFGEIKITIWKEPLFKKKVYYWSFSYVSTFPKKVFSRAPVKCFSLYGSNDSDLLVFGNGAFGEITECFCERDLFKKKKIALEVLSSCVLYIKSTSELLLSLLLK